MAEPRTLKIPSGTLAQKLALVGGLLEAIRIAHMEELTHNQWYRLNSAEKDIALAMMEKTLPKCIIFGDTMTPAFSKGYSLRK